MTMVQNEKERPGKGAPQMELATAIVPVSGGLTPAQKDALRVAHELVDAGVPIFVASRNNSVPDNHHMPFHLPNGWQNWRPRHDVVDRWKPGMAMAAVCGVQFDVLDTDLQNSGHIARAELEREGLWPESFGTQRTASGGTHDLIIRTHLAKGVPAQGVDLQAGADDGTGRGFVFLAPTVKYSKTTGEMTEYRWEVEPNLAALKAAEPSETYRRFLIHVAKPKAKKAAPVAASMPAATGDDDLFTPAADEMSPTYAATQIQNALDAIRAMSQGEVNTVLGGQARWIGRFVAGGHLTAEDATQRIREAVEANGVHSDSWNAANGVKWSLASLIGDSFSRAMEEPIGVKALPEGANPHRYDSIAWHEFEAKAEEVKATRRTSLKDALRAQLLNLKQLRELPPAKPLIKGILDLDSSTWLIGQPGGFKSFVALDWACHVATGKAWRGRKTVHGEVIYVVAEGTRSFAKRVDAWAKHHEVEPDRLLILPVAVQAKGSDGVSERWEALVELISEVEPSLVVLDTQARLTVGMEENSNTEMGVWVEAVDMVKRASNGCVLVVHHTGRNGQDARGASALDGAQDAEWKVERPKDKLECTLRMEKNKDGDDQQKWSYHMTVVDVGLDEDGDVVTSLVLGDEMTGEANSVAAVDARIIEEGESLTTGEYVLRTVELCEVQGGGLTKVEIRSLLNSKMTEAGRPPVKADTLLKAIDRLVSRGELFQKGARFTVVDPDEGTEADPQNNF